MEDGERGQSDASDQRDGEHGEQSELQASEEVAELGVAAAQRVLVEGFDAIGNLEHGGAAGDQILVEEREAIFVAFVSGPGKCVVQHLPVVFDLRAQVLKWRGFFGLDG